MGHTSMNIRSEMENTDNIVQTVSPVICSADYFNGLNINIKNITT
jgi:hypothetical protein